MIKRDKLSLINLNNLTQSLDLIWSKLSDIEMLIKKKSRAPLKLNLINSIVSMINTLILLNKLRKINQQLKRMLMSLNPSILMKNFKRELTDSIS